MLQSGGISFFIPNDDGINEVYAVTIKLDPENGPIIIDSLGHEFVLKEEQ